jgi:putative ABC transport system ATP-binding protein
VVPQEPFLFSNTIAENVRFASPGSSDQEIISVFDMLGLNDWLESLERGLDTQVGQRGSAMSAGERQLVALARAAIVNPDILILDEATSSIDSVTEVRLSHALAVLSKGRTTIAIAHRLSTAARADRILLLADGRIVEDGTHSDLLLRNGLYRALYDVWTSSTEVRQST